MRIIVNDSNNVVIAAGTNLTEAQINSTHQSWCKNYVMPPSFTVYSNVDLPAGFYPDCWLYYEPNTWQIIPGKELLVQTLIDKTTVATFTNDLSFVATLVENSTMIYVDLLWTRMENVSMYEVRYKPEGGEYYTELVMESGELFPTIRITGLLVDTNYFFSMRAFTIWGPTEWSADVVKKAPSSLASVVDAELLDPAALLKKLNGDLSDDRIYSYLVDEDISFTELMETRNAAALQDALEEGSIGVLPEVLYSLGRDVILLAGEASSQSAKLEILKDRVGLKLTNNGHVSGMAIGWLDENTSEVVFLSDVFKIVLPGGFGEPVQAFTLKEVEGVPTLCLNGDLLAAGTITAEHLAAFSLYIGTNPVTGEVGRIIMGEGAVIEWENLTENSQNKLVDGATRYTWIKFADDAFGTNIVDVPISTSKYLGLAINKTTDVESNDYTEYRWSLIAGKGTVTGVSFKRSTLPPDKPLNTVGSYSDPNAIADGWTDGITGDDSVPLWMTSRVFTSDGTAPQQSEWTNPSLIAAPTDSVSVQFSATAEIDTWHYPGQTDDLWMRTGTKVGTGEWVYSGAVLIKGEKGDPGDPGTPGRYTSYVFKASPGLTAPAKPTGTDPDVSSQGWLDYPEVTSDPIWMSSTIVDASTNEAGTWSDPIRTTGIDGVAQPGAYVVFQYAKSSSSVTAPSAELFSETVPEILENEFMWMRAGTVESGDTVPDTWNTPYRVSGEKGTPGDPGASIDIVFVRSAAEPGIPNPSPGTPTTPITWYTNVNSVPAGVDPMWSSVGTKIGNAVNFTWQTPVKLEATDGQPGKTFAELSVYSRSSTVLTSAPTGGSYNFSSMVTDPPTGSTTWTSYVPNGTVPCYVSRAVATITGTTGTDSTLTWSTPTKAFADGGKGDTGTSVQIAYSATQNGTFEERAFTAGDVWFKTKLSTSGTWGPAARIVGMDAISVTTSFDNCNIPCNSSGTPLTGAYSSTSVTIRVYEGATELDYLSPGTGVGKYYVSAAFSTNVNAGVTVSDSGASPSYGVSSALTSITANSGSVIFTITGTSLSGTAFVLTKKVNYSKSLGGVSLTIAVAGLHSERASSPVVGTFYTCTLPTDTQSATYDSDLVMAGRTLYCQTAGVWTTLTGSFVAENIVGKVITGKTIKTSGVGSRIEINNDDYPNQIASYGAEGGATAIFGSTGSDGVVQISSETNQALFITSTYRNSALITNIAYDTDGCSLDVSSTFNPALKAYHPNEFPVIQVTAQGDGYSGDFSGGSGLRTDDLVVTGNVTGFTKATMTYDSGVLTITTS